MVSMEAAPSISGLKAAAPAPIESSIFTKKLIITKFR